jgi:hypothetical protein
MPRAIATLSLVLAACGLCGLSLVAQTTSADAPPQPQVHADLNQLMRGLLYPAANVVFSAQTDDPAKKKWPDGHDPTMSTDPVIGAFGGWPAVENASLTLAESANLLMLAGRNCSNGTPVPVKDPAWAAFVQVLRDGSMKAYQAAKTKDMDKMIEASDAVNASCEGCHRKWRNPRSAANRCK